MNGVHLVKSDASLGSYPGLASLFVVHCIRQRCSSRPISRVLFPPGHEPVEGSDHLSRTTVTRRLQQPTRGLRTSSPQRGRGSPPTPRPLLGLAPGGVCLAGPVARAAGEPLPHLFTLTVTAVCFCGTFHRVAPPGCYPAPCSVELGLSSDSFPRAKTKPHCGKSRPRSPGLLKHQFNYSTYEPRCQVFDKMFPLDYHLGAFHLGSSKIRVTTTTEKDYG